MSYLTYKTNSVAASGTNIPLTLTSLVTGTPSNTNLLGYTGGNYSAVSKDNLTHSYGNAVFNWWNTSPVSTGTVFYSLNDLIIYYTTGLRNYPTLVAANASYTIGSYGGWYMANKFTGSVGKTLLLECIFSNDLASGANYTIQWQAGSGPTDLSPIGPKTYMDDESCAVCCGIYTVPNATDSYIGIKVVSLSGSIGVTDGNNFILTSYNVREV
jgi:hypothetical protein